MPDPNIPTTAVIRDRIISDIESKIGQETPLLQKAFTRVLATAISGAFTILYKYGQWSKDQIFTSTQDYDSLELKGDQYNIPKTAAVPAKLTADFTGTDAALIPAGQQFRGNSNGLVYSVDDLIEIEAGTASDGITCLTAGDAGTLTVGSVVTILSPISGIDNQATISAIVIEGEDEEDIENYRGRIQAREKLPPQGGSLNDYRAWAREVADITTVFAWGKREESTITAGYVLVYPLSDGEDRIPSAAKLTEVKEYIGDPERAPTQCVKIEVLAMTERDFDIDVSALTPNTAEIRNAFETNVTEYLLEREPKQFINQVEYKNVISRSGIEAIAINSGAESITLELFIDGTATPIESHTLLYYELAKLGSVTFA